MELIEVEIIKIELPGKQEGVGVFSFFFLFFPSEKTTLFYSQRKTDISDTVEIVLGTEIWDRHCDLHGWPGEVMQGSKDHCVSLEMTPPGQAHPKGGTR